MTEADDWAAEVVEGCARQVPEVLDLAIAVSLASRVEPALLRRARLELCSGIHAGAESELWHSSLVQHRSPKAIVFAPAVAWLLQQRLKEGERPGLEASWKLLQATHAGLPDAIRLEEEITWRAVRNAADPEIPALLRRAVRTLMDGEMPDLAQWAARALPRLPPPVRRSPDAWLLALAASSRLGGLAVLGEPMPEGLPADDLLWIAAQSAEKVPVYLRRKEGALLLSLRAGDGGAQAPSLAAPSTHPVLLEATVGDGAPRLVALRPEGPDPEPLPLGAGGLRLRTAAGEVLRVEVPLETGGEARDLLARSPFQAAGALPPGSPVFFGRAAELHEILEGIQNDSFLIVGPRRIGKTSLLNQVLHALKNRKGIRPLWMDCQGARRAEDLRPEVSVLRSSPGSLSGGSRIGDLFREVAWEAGGNGEQPVFLMNEVDGLVSGDPDLLRELRSLTGEAAARFVFTGFAAAPEAAEMPGGTLDWVRGFAGQPAFSLGPLEPDAARALLARLEGPEVGLIWESRAVRETAYARILERTSALPWLLQETCTGILRRLTERGAAVASLEDVDAVLDAVMDLTTALRPETAFTTEPVDPSNSRSPRVAWGDDGRAWRLERASGDPLLLLSAAELVHGTPLVVTGEARAGLRSFLAWIRWLSETGGERFRFVVLDATHLDSSGERSTARSFGQTLLDQFEGILRQRLEKEKLKGLSAIASRSFRTALEWYGRSLGRDQPLVLAVVGLDVLPKALLAPLLSDLRASLERFGGARWGNLILATRHPQSLSGDPSHRPIANLALTCRLPSLAPAEIAGLWDRFGPGKPTTPETPEVGSLCFSWTGGQPLLVQLFLREAARGDLDLDQVARRLVERPPEAVLLWQQDLAAILQDDPQARRFLSGVLDGQEPPSTRAAEQLFHAGWLRPGPQHGWSIRSKAHAEWARLVLAPSNPPS